LRRNQKNASLALMTSWSMTGCLTITLSVLSLAGCNHKKSTDSGGDNSGGVGTSGGGGGTSQSSATLLTDVSKVVVNPGDTVTFTGSGLNASLQLKRDDSSDPTELQNLTVVDSVTAKYIIPQKAPYGPLNLTATQSTSVQKLTLFSTGTNLDHPVMAVDAKQVCSDTQYYDGTGTLTTGTRSCPTYTNCSSDGATGCVAVTSFPAAKLANFAAGNVQSGTTIAGVAGSLPACTSDGQTGCVASSILPAAAITGFSTWNIRAGTTLAGVTGTLKTNCRNTVNSTYFNYDGAVGSLPNIGVTSGTSADYWDTTDDNYGWSTNKVTAWSSNTYCDSSTWVDVTTTNGGTSNVACGTSNTCIYKDLISNLQVTGILASGSNTTSNTSPAGYTWSGAVIACAGSTYGGYAAGTWRLPTQKETISMYLHGIVSMANANFMSLTNMQTYSLWTASTVSNNVTYAWVAPLINGGGGGIIALKTGGFPIICVK